MTASCKLIFKEFLKHFFLQYLFEIVKMSCALHIPARTIFKKRKDSLKNYLAQNCVRKGWKMNSKLDE